MAGTVHRLVLAGGLLLMATLTQVARAGDLQVGKIYHGFKLLEHRPVKEISADAYLFEHVASGARLLKLASADDNKTFCISFKTLPQDDTGVPHILEHSVLGGSRKFPVKSPFDILAKGSLNTFLNAMTSADFTMYPVASRNRKDFVNLMNVYLDAVFHPRIYQDKRIFLQEGWRLELAQPDGELAYNGIVYNEMKGAFSSPARVLDFIVSRALFPDNTYGHSSGGYPDNIPQLSYEKFLEFHRTYYHPSNSYITIYGDGDVLQELKFIDENYLAEFKRQPPVPELRQQAAFDKIKEVSDHYPIGPEEDPSDKTFLELAFVAGGAGDQQLSMALDVLTDVLVNLPAAPLRRALQDAGIGHDVYASYDELKQGVIGIVVKNANAGDRDRFRDIVFTTLRRVVTEGIDKKDIEGVINRKEFMLREADYGGFPKGLVYTYFSLRSWMFAGDPLPALAYDKSLAYVRRALHEPLLEGMVRKYLLDNKHAVLAVVEPQQGLEQQRLAGLRQKLREMKKKLPAAEIARLVKQTADLRVWQSTPDRPEDVAKIPMLGIADLDPQAESFPLEQRQVQGVPVLFAPQSTNGIIYLRLLFDARVVPQEMVWLLPVLAHVWGQMDTANYDYGRLNTELNIHTGGLSLSLSLFPDSRQPENFQPKLEARAKALTPKFAKLVELEREVLLRTRLTDDQRLKEVLGELYSRLQGMVRSAGSYLAYQRAASYLGSRGMYGEVTSGLSYFKQVDKLFRHYSRDSGQLAADLQMLAGLLFSRRGLLLAVTCSEEDYPVFEKHIGTLLAALGDAPPRLQEFKLAPEARNEGLLAPSKVQYVYRSADFRALGYQFRGRMQVLRQILSRDYLTREIRIKGGAYGAWASFSRDGLATLASYRDPNLRKTFTAFDGAAAYLQGFSASDAEMTRYIIGTIARLDQPRTPAGKGEAAVSYHLRHVSQQQRQAERTEILATRQEDIRDMAKLVEDILKHAVLCVYGSEKVLRENKQLFERLVRVLH